MPDSVCLSVSLLTFIWKWTEKLRRFYWAGNGLPPFNTNSLLKVNGIMGLPSVAIR